MKPTFKKSFIFIFLIFSFSLLQFASCKKKAEQGEIKYFKVKYSDLQDMIKVTGVIKPQVGAEIKVGSRISGTLQKLLVKVGDYVEKGKVIAVIEHNDLKLKIKELQYNLQSYKTELKFINEEYPEKIKGKMLSMKSLQIKRDYLRNELKRNEKLYQSKMISKQSLENFKKEYESLQKSIDAEKTSLNVLKKEFDYKRKSLQLKINQVLQQIKIAEIDLGYAFIKAPISGVISSVSTQEGETVAASFSSPVFVNIIDLNRLEAVAYIDETDIGKIKCGQKVTFYVEAYPERQYKGFVKKIYPKADVANNVVTYKIEVDISDKSEKIYKDIKPEMTAYLDIIIKEKKHVLTAPLQCFKLIGTENFAFLKGQDGKIRKKKVKIGIVNNGIAEIVKGLNAGDEIVIKGFKYVHSF
jgi:multidrug resistance efflux pump